MEQYLRHLSCIQIHAGKGNTCTSFVTAPRPIHFEKGDYTRCKTYKGCRGQRQLGKTCLHIAAKIALVCIVCVRVCVISNTRKATNNKQRSFFIDDFHILSYVV
eukprot:TRINITY_DN32972_c0_g1_i1.p1 TRINITY_DN32972_c0_g1~~TRINITY_DN32972_c0_g1_i1.p1  ORF type:complete len:104 (+),score=0.40 TRINITY_DN32972_c0_g1_i1:196-507(+)